MTNTQPGTLFTVTIESRRPDTHQWEITAQATDTLAGLAEWAAPANPTCEPPRLPLTTEAVRGFIGSAFERDDIRNRVRLEPAAPGEKSTLDTLRAGAPTPPALARIGSGCPGFTFGFKLIKNLMHESCSFLDQQRRDAACGCALPGPHARRSRSRRDDPRTW